jgi:hypothetical protein
MDSLPGVHAEIETAKENICFCEECRKSHVWWKICDDFLKTVLHDVRRVFPSFWMDILWISKKSQWLSPIADENIDLILEIYTLFQTMAHTLTLISLHPHLLPPPTQTYTQTYKHTYRNHRVSILSVCLPMILNSALPFKSMFVTMCWFSHSNRHSIRRREVYWLFSVNLPVRELTTGNLGCQPIWSFNSRVCNILCNTKLMWIRGDNMLIQVTFPPPPVNLSADKFVYVAVRNSPWDCQIKKDIMACWIAHSMFAWNAQSDQTYILKVSASHLEDGWWIG